MITALLSSSDCLSPGRGLRACRPRRLQALRHAGSPSPLRASHAYHLFWHRRIGCGSARFAPPSASPTSFNPHSRRVGSGLVQGIFCPPARRTIVCLLPRTRAPRRRAKNALPKNATSAVMCSSPRSDQPTRSAVASWPSIAIERRRPAPRSRANGCIPTACATARLYTSFDQGSIW